MANSDTIFALFGGTGRNQILPLTLAATTETVFLQASDTSGVTSPAVLSVPGTDPTQGFVGAGTSVDFNQNKAISSQSFGRKYHVGTTAPFFSTATFDAGRPFRIRVSGRATSNAGTANTLAIKLYLGTSATVGSDTLIASITAGGATASSYTFLAEAFIQWDSVANVLSGFFTGVIGNTLTANTALSNAATTTSSNSLDFVVSATFGNAAGGVATISEFAVEQV